VHTCYSFFEHRINLETTLPCLSLLSLPVLPLCSADLRRILTSSRLYAHARTLSSFGSVPKCRVYVFSCVYVRSTLDGSMDLLIPVKHDGNCRIQVYIMRTFSHQMPQSCSGRHLFRCRCSRTSRRWDLAWLVGMRKRSKVPCWSTRLCDRLTLRSRLRGEKERGQRRVCQIWISSSAECCQP
jgi:hypothetical protein